MAANIYRRNLLAGDIEPTYRGGGTLDLHADTMDVGEITFTPNIERLQRNASRPDFSPLPARSGRKTASITIPVEVNGSGTTDAGRPPSYGKLLRACAFAETQILTAGIPYSYASPSNAKLDVTTAEGTGDAYTGTMPRLITVTVTDTAAATVYAPDAPNGDEEYTALNVALTSGTPFAGPQGAMMAITYTGDLIPGDMYFFLATPPGHMYTPASDPETQESVFFDYYAGNKKHRITGARGTFSMTATAGQFAQLQFNFTGDYQDPTPDPMPDETAYSYGRYPLPPMVELADVTVDGQLLALPTTYGFDLSGQVNARMSANAAFGNEGAIITGRSPTATFNMDSVALSEMDPWTMMSSARQILLSGYVGTDPGNTMIFLANGQVSNTGYANMENQRKNDQQMDLSRIDGNDELILFIS